MTIKLIEHPCVEIVYPHDRWRSFHGYKCGKRGKVEVDSKWYCGIHDPVKNEEKQKKRKEKWALESKLIRETARRLKAERDYCLNLSTEYLETHQAAE